MQAFHQYHPHFSWISQQSPQCQPFKTAGTQRKGYIWSCNLYIGTIEALNSSHFAINAYIDYTQIPTIYIILLQSNNEDLDVLDLMLMLTLVASVTPSGKNCSNTDHKVSLCNRHMPATDFGHTQHRKSIIVSLNISH